MANLKSDLDEYLLSNDSRKGFKFGLPFSTPKIFSRNSDESPSSSASSGGSWFSETQKEYCTLSRTQRIIGFAACVCFGTLCFILSGLYIPFLLLKARKFALLFTLGSLFFIFSFTFLYGPCAHMRSLFSRERGLRTGVYGVTLVLTLYAALHLQNTPLTVVFAVAQVLALMWSMLGSVPGGAAGARFFGSMFKSTVSNTLPI